MSVHEQHGGPRAISVGHGNEQFDIGRLAAFGVQHDPLFGERGAAISQQKEG
jgi:hypothetical protein